MSKKDLKQVKKDLKKLGIIWFVTGMGLLVGGLAFWFYLMN